MLEVKYEVDTKQLKRYVSDHETTLGAQVGFYGNGKRKQAVSLETQKHNTHSRRSSGFAQLVRNTVKSKDSLSNASVAYENIYGNKKRKIPARNFYKKASEPKYWEEKNFTFLGEFLKQTPNVAEARRGFANVGSAIVKHAIDDFKTPQNAKPTIKNKGQNNPLIDTGQMLKAVKGKVLP